MSIPKGAALGSTSDPKALVVGDASSLDSAADKLKTEATKIRDVGLDLKAVKTPSWTGAASDGFWMFFGAEPQVWQAIADVMTKSEAALRDQAGALRTAQDKAQDAIDKWEQGEQATQTATTAYNDRVEKHNTTIENGGFSLPPGPFSDPGDALREEAQQVLDAAAAALDEAGLQNAGTLAELGGLSWNESTGDVEGPGVDGEVDGPSFSHSDPNAFGGDDKPWKKPGEDGYSASLSLGSISGSAYLAQVSGSTEGNYHGIDYAAEGEVFLGAEADAGINVTDTSVEATASATVGVSASGSASAEYGYLGVEAEGSAMAGATAEGTIGVGTDGVHASGEVFAGAQAEGSIGGDVGGVGGAVTGEAWAGVGASADVNAGMNDDGSFTIGGHFGVGLGIGGQIGGEITIDPEEVVDTVGDIADGVGDFAEDAGGALADGAETVGGWLGL